MSEETAAANDFMFILDELYKPKVIHKVDSEKQKTGQLKIESAFEKDKEFLIELYEELSGRSSRIKLGPETQKLVSIIESEITLKKIREYFSDDVRPEGKDFYGSVTLTLSAEPTYINFVNSRENINAVGTIDDPGRKLFWIEIVNGSNPIQYALNRSKNSKTMITTLAASGSKKYESPVGTFESILLRAVSGGNSTVTLFGFY